MSGVQVKKSVVMGKSFCTSKHNYLHFVAKVKETKMTRKKVFLSGGILTRRLEITALGAALAAALVLAACATSGGDGDASAQAVQLAADINAIQAGSAEASGDTVTLSGGVRLENAALTVPAGVTLDLTAEALTLGNGATLTVNGVVDAKAEGVSIDSAAASPAAIKGSGSIRLKSKGLLLGIWEGKKLTLDGVTLVGLPDNDRPVVEVGNGGVFVFSSGTITGNSRTDPGESGGAGMGGGVLVHGGGTFTMEGGTITGNSAVRRGGGVCNAGTFTMKGGVIFGNSADIGGGVSNVDDSNVFIMEGGRIQGSTDSDGFTKNTAATRGAAMQAWPMAKWPTSGTYTNGGVPQSGGSDIVTGNDWTDDTLIAVPAK
jgi:hypothetical protein